MDTINKTYKELLNAYSSTLSTLFKPDEDISAEQWTRDNLEDAVCAMVNAQSCYYAYDVFSDDSLSTFKKHIDKALYELLKCTVGSDDNKWASDSIEEALKEMNEALNILYYANM